MHPENLLLTVDPSFDAESIIEQIQNYTKLIKSEIEVLVSNKCLYLH